MPALTTIREDIDAVFQHDPAARTTLEVVLAYPGIHAIWIHRGAHWLWQHNLKLLGRLLSEFSRWITGVEIHPADVHPDGTRYVMDKVDCRPSDTCFASQRP